MFHITVAATTPPVAVVSSALSKTITVMMAPNSMGQGVVLGHNVILLPPFILRKTMMGSVGLITVLQQWPQFQVPS